jgi:hypothetical protein
MNSFGACLLSAVDVAALDFFCADCGEGNKTIRFAHQSVRAVISTALKSLRRWAANARNHWQDSLSKADQIHATLRRLSQQRHHHTLHDEFADGDEIREI